MRTNISAIFQVLPAAGRSSELGKIHTFCSYSSSSNSSSRMYPAAGSAAISCSSSCFPSLPDLDEPLTEQDLEAIDVIEATFRSSTPSSASGSSIKEQYSTGQDERTQKRPCRRLPSSFLDLCSPFPLSPCQGAATKMRYPALNFGGRISYSRTSMEVEKDARELLRSIEAKRGGSCQVAVGFDIEWKPTFKRGALPSKAAVMQLCADVGQCYVMHIIHSGVTPTLRLLLQDCTLLKVGVGIGNDATKVFKDYNVSVQAVEDLSYLANQKLGGQPKKWGLAALAETLVSKELPKPKKVRLGNWEVKFLTKQQIQYAATDAFASWQLYQVLKDLADTTDEASGSVEVMAAP
ncbi:3'-5' exonuclease [Linum grandiflorum]